MKRSDTTTAAAMARILRAAPFVKLPHAADAAGVSERSAGRILKSSLRRGRDALVVERFAGLDPRLRAVIAAGRWCPPALSRLAAGDNDETVRDAGSGVACWSGRSHLHNIASLGVFASAARGEDFKIRAMVATNPRCPSAILARLADDGYEARARRQMRPGRGGAAADHRITGAESRPAGAMSQPQGPRR